MKAMTLNRLVNLDENKKPLELVNLPVPEPQADEVQIKVSVCGVCHTELDEIEGRTSPPRFPIVLGHQVVGRVEKMGTLATRFTPGARVGIAWIHSACGQCAFCLRGDENLCPDFQGTGRDVAGGYAEYTVVPERFAYPIPDVFSDAQAAPLLCAGAIGYRSLRLTGIRDGQNLGLVGFGASAHLVLKMVRSRYPNSKVYVFVRSDSEKAFARELGAVWAGDIEEESPEKLPGIIDTTPAWKPVMEAMKNLEKGGRLVINAIRKEDRDKASLLQIDYPRDLWLEKEIKSVANVTRRDVEECLALAAEIPIRPEVQEYRLEEANQALLELKERKIRGAKVLRT
ncbi:MAG: alcohol dehydrogenase [Desulfobacca sp.]|nr:alcohol dehydrogenase [Desulfobacca sp.]